jgi:trigger factor
MQVTETNSDPLHREFTVVIGATDLEAKLTGKIVEMQPKIHLKGFRPGKAPVSFLKKTYGKSLMGEIVNETITESSERLLKEKEIKPATTPRVDFVNPLDNVIAGTADLEFIMKVDLMPDFTLANLSELKAERLVADVSEDAVEEALKRLADSQKTYSDKGEGALAEKGDAVTIDFEGKIAGETFEGGKAEGFDLTLGSGAFIPGFEDQLIGLKAGDERNVPVQFPKNYNAPNLAGKDAEFAVTVKAVKSSNEVVINDEFAKKVGIDSLAELKGRVRDQLQSEYARASRTHLKRRILDSLDSAHSFGLPGGMVQAEFDAIWQQVQAEMQREGVSPEDEGKSEDELRSEYHGIAERRVRLGLVLAKIGEQNAITVGQDEVNRALAAQARQYPGKEKEVIQHFTSNPQAIAQLRVPLFEDKVIDFLGELIEVQDRKVGRDILFLDPDDAEEKLKAAEAQPAAETKPATEPDEAKPAKKPKAKEAAKAKAKDETKPAGAGKAKSENKPKAKKK